MQPLRKTQFFLVFFAFAVLVVGILIVIPSWGVYWHTPTTADFDLSINLCPASINKDPATNSFHFVGHEGPCPLDYSSISTRSPPPSPSPSPFPSPSPSPSPYSLSPSDQLFDPGEDYFDGGVFPIGSIVFATKRVTGSLVWEIVREDSPDIFATQTVDIIDSDLTGNFGVVGGGNISFIRNSPQFNLAGWTNDNEECLSPPGCTYYPLFSTFPVPSSSTFLLPDSDEKYLVRVKDVNLYFATNLTTLVPIDIILHFENRHAEDEATAFFFLIVGFLLIDATPGIAYFLWFQEEAYYGNVDLPEESGL